MDFELKTIMDLSTKLFNPFEINNDIYYPLCDPDAHYWIKCTYQPELQLLQRTFIF